jgi:formyl-CoA transferase
MKPLEGLRVLDFTRILAGPFSTMLLADMGAEVIKIEEPQKGDETRAYGPPFFEGFSTYFLSVNRGKKSLTLNLKHPKARGMLITLLHSSDILVENFRPGTMSKLNLDYPSVSSLNPKLIYCSISGYGQTGPEALKPGYDLVIQGISGLMDLTGNPDGPPLKVGTSIADLVAGLTAVQSILLALIQREKTGKGTFLDIALLDSLAAMLTYQAGLHFIGIEPKRMGNQHPSICPYETFQAKDGYFNIAAANDKLWKTFCEGIGHSELIADPRFKTNPDRVQNRPDLVKILNKIFKERAASEWVDLLQQQGIPAGLIFSVSEVLEHPHLKEREMIMNLPINGKGFRFLANPISVIREEKDKSTPPPSLGEHTEKVLREILKLLPSDIATLKREGVV